jgi:hypothetical protein
MRRVAALMLLALVPAACPRPAAAQTSWVTVDLETLAEFTLDATVTCPLGYASYVSGSYEGCPVGRAPVSGECGLSNTCGEPVPVPDAVAVADHFWTHLYALPLVLDLGTPASSVFVFNAADHGPFPEESVEWTVWGADQPFTRDFPAGWAPAQLCAIFRQGWVETGDCPGDDADDFTGLYVFDRPYRYVAVYSNYSITIFADRAQSAWSIDGDDLGTDGWQSADAELDAVAQPQGPPPGLDLGPDRGGCTDEDMVLDLGLSNGPALKAGWDTDGDGAVDVTGPGPVTVRYGQPGTYVVRVFVIGACGCAADEVTIEVRACPLLSVRFGEVEARRTAAGVEVGFETLEEVDTIGFVVERAPAAAGPFAATPEFIQASGPRRYRVHDPGLPDRAPTFYRVVEYTSDGRGDESPVFQAGSGAPGGAGVGSGRRRR